MSVRILHQILYLYLPTFMISQLGFTGGRVAGWFGDALKSNFAMDDIHCEGDEEHIQDCSYRSVDNCNIAESAGVRCHY